MFSSDNKREIHEQSGERERILQLIDKWLDFKVILCGFAHEEMRKRIRLGVYNVLLSAQNCPLRSGGNLACAHNFDRGGARNMPQAFHQDLFFLVDYCVQNSLIDDSNASDLKNKILFIRNKFFILDKLAAFVHMPNLYNESAYSDCDLVSVMRGLGYENFQINESRNAYSPAVDLDDFREKIKQHQMVLVEEIMELMKFLKRII
jgi:hypothetical protein